MADFTTKLGQNVVTVDFKSRLTVTNYPNVLNRIGPNHIKKMYLGLFFFLACHTTGHGEL